MIGAKNDKEKRGMVHLRRLWEGDGAGSVISWDVPHEGDGRVRATENVGDLPTVKLVAHTPICGETEEEGLTITTWGGYKEPRGGRLIRTTWSRFGDRVARPNTYKSKYDVPFWSAAQFTDGRRCADKVELVHALVLDVDTPTPIDTLADQLEDVRSISHTSWSSTHDSPRWRVMIQLSRPVRPSEYPHIWEYGSTIVRADPQAKDASRGWFAPAKGGEHYDYFATFGCPLNVDNILANVDPEETAPAGVSVSYRGDEERRAADYVRKMRPAISGQGGHAQTYSAAVACVRGFGLSAAQTMQILLTEFNPRCSPPWSRSQLEHKVSSAIRKSTKPLGYLLQSE